MLRKEIPNLEGMGAWLDSSDEWSSVPDEVKEEIGLTFKEDGEFLMSLEHLKKYFDDAEICDLYRQMRKTLKTGPT